MHYTLFIYILIFHFLTACSPYVYKKQFKTGRGVVANKAMVVTAHPLASQIGIDILKNGGNAFDAAIAVHFALAVAYPRAGNIGGGGFAVLRLANGYSETLDFREKAPIASTETMYLDELGNPIENLSIAGVLAVGVPGSVDGMVHLHKKYGSMAWHKLLQPAIELAFKGVTLTKFEAEKINQYQQQFYQENRFEIPFLNDEGWKSGDKLVQKDLANTLKRIRDNGRAGFFEGETAQLLLDEIAAGKGIITQDDLTHYQAKWRKPIIGTYRGFKIFTMPPPSSGGVALLQLLNGWEKHASTFNDGPNGVQTIHNMAELERRVYANRAIYLGDSDFTFVPVDTLISDSWTKKMTTTIRQDTVTASQSILKGKVDKIESLETTHTSIVDQFGNAIAITTTLNGNFGSKVMVKGAGFFLNNEMDDFSIKPGHPNQFGLVGSEANKIEPEKRMLSSMTPTLLEKENSLFMVVGTPGGSTIITSVFQTIVNVIDFDMTLHQAVNAPKVHHQWLPDQIIYENNRLADNILHKLQALGHQIEGRDKIGKLKGILVLPNGQLEGAVDDRQNDTAVGF